VSGPGVVVERSNIPSQPYEIAKNGNKTCGFEHVFADKSPKTPFFAIKYLTRYTRETFFEEYINPRSATATYTSPTNLIFLKAQNP
jgi:hypothetical protein